MQNSTYVPNQKKISTIFSTYVLTMNTYQPGTVGKGRGLGRSRSSVQGPRETLLQNKWTSETMALEVEVLDPDDCSCPRLM